MMWLAKVGEDGDEFQDWIVDKDMDHELKIAQKEELDQRKDLLKDSIKILNEREKEILYSRRLTDEPTTLEDLSKKFKISRERIRQGDFVSYTWPDLLYQATQMTKTPSNHPHLLFLLVTVPNSFPLFPSVSPTWSFNSVGNGPSPTLVVYAFVIPKT